MIDRSFFPLCSCCIRSVSRPQKTFAEFEEERKEKRKREEANPLAPITQRHVREEEERERGRRFAKRELKKDSIVSYSDQRSDRVILLLLRLPSSHPIAQKRRIKLGKCLIKIKHIN